ncbi:MAG: YjfB family protein [Ruminiclostridium sp.]|nr:YjfB family protein [Ruminiclostridium sp.]
MDGFTNLMATMSIGLSQTNVASQASIAMLKNSMNASEAANAKMMESISEAVPSADARGALMDVRA